MFDSGITSGTPSRILFGPGVYFKGATYNEKVAPTAEEIQAGLMGATQEGGTLSITPEIFTPELDGATVALKEFQYKVGEVAQMEVSFVELTPDLVARMVIGAISETTDGEYDVITSSDIRIGHFYEGFGFKGKLRDGRPVILLFKNALCISGLSTDTKNKTNSVFKGTFACQSDIAYSTTKLPYAIFIRKAEGWTPVNPEEIAEAE